MGWVRLTRFLGLPLFRRKSINLFRQGELEFSCWWLFGFLWWISWERALRSSSNKIKTLFLNKADLRSVISNKVEAVGGVFVKFDRFVVLAAYNLIHRCYHESPPKMIMKALLGVGFAGGSALLGGNCRRWISTNCAFFCIFIWWVRKKFVILHPKTKRKVVWPRG